MSHHRCVVESIKTDIEAMQVRYWWSSFRSGKICLLQALKNTCEAFYVILTQTNGLQKYGVRITTYLYFNGKHTYIGALYFAFCQTYINASGFLGLPHMKVLNIIPIINNMYITNSGSNSFYCRVDCKTYNTYQKDIENT